ncbi:Integral membrane protein OS=Streptomyces alboniger OX=132473 GN=CP975_13515 PE=4 SV=1 [Streptomyces alboniger]
MTGTLVTRRTANGATALGGGRRWRPSPYAVFGGLFWLVMSLAFWRVPMCCDFGQHAAVVERLKDDLLHPAHPMADLPGEGSPYYSPYAVVQGLFAQVTGLAGWEVVKLGGPLNLLVLLTGIGRFVRVLTPRPWAPVLALGAMVLLWGTRMAWWSGYLGLMSMTGNLGYPSTFAIGLAFWAWAWAGALARDPRGGLRPRDLRPRDLRPYVGLGALCGLILLIHPISSVAAVIGVVAFAASGLARGGGPRTAVRWAVTALTAVVLASVWPYYSVFSLVGDESVDWIHRQLYVEMPQRFWLALLGLPALWLRFRRNRSDPLVLMFALDCLVVAYGWFSGHYTYGRILGLTLVPLQFALAIELAAPRTWGWRRGALAGAAALGACVGFLQIQAGAVVPRALDPIGFDQPPRWPSYGWAVGHMRHGDVVLTDGYRPTRSVPGYGANLVAPAWPDASLDEGARNRRLEAVRAYLAPGSTRAERTAIVRRYGVRWLLLTPDQKVPPEAVVVDWSRGTGEVLARVGGRGRG